MQKDKILSQCCKHSTERTKERSSELLQYIPLWELFCTNCNKKLTANGKVKKFKITRELLYNTPKWHILATWIFCDSGCTYICGTGNQLKWVAVKCYNNTFKIYHEYIYANEDPYRPNLWERNDIQIKCYWNKLSHKLVTEVVDLEDWLLMHYDI